MMVTPPQLEKFPSLPTKLEKMRELRIPGALASCLPRQLSNLRYAPSSIYTFAPCDLYAKQLDPIRTDLKREYRSSLLPQKKGFSWFRLNLGRRNLSRGIRIMAEVEISEVRKVVRTLVSKEQAEGQGARVRRSIGRPEMKMLDPFLLLDHFSGFPDHPHRGFETVTYMMEGHSLHEDFAGHKGTLGPGDLQWMTAGRGIVHSEMPKYTTPCKGLQLWVNLAAKDKMIEPNYQELAAKDVPKVEKDGIKVAVIAGESFGVHSPVYTRTPTMYLDFTMQPGTVLKQKVPQGWNAFLYTLEGQITVGAEEATPIDSFHTVQLTQGDGVIVWNKGASPAHFVLIGGQPLNEPVVQHGPFVMNTADQIMQTMRDYQYGRNGFERARGWQSAAVPQR